MTSYNCMASPVGISSSKVRTLPETRFKIFALALEHILIRSEITKSNLKGRECVCVDINWLVSSIITTVSQETHLHFCNYKTTEPTLVDYTVRSISFRTVFF
jgi:hypothetical protein